MMITFQFKFTLISFQGSLAYLNSENGIVIAIVNILIFYFILCKLFRETALRHFKAVNYLTILDIMSKSVT